MLFDKSGIEHASNGEAEDTPQFDARAKRAVRQIKLDGLDQNIGLHLGIAHSLTVLKLDPKLNRLGLTAKQVTILWLAEANPGISQVEIARFLELERSTIHQFAKSLVKNGLLELLPNLTDRRSQGMHLTSAGNEALAYAREVVAQHEVEANVRLTTVERSLLLQLLTKLCGGSDVNRRGEMTDLDANSS